MDCLCAWVSDFGQKMDQIRTKSGKSGILTINFPNKLAEYEKYKVKNINTHCLTYLRYNQVLPLFMVVRFWAWIRPDLQNMFKKRWFSAHHRDRLVLYVFFFLKSGSISKSLDIRIHNYWFRFVIAMCKWCTFFEFLSFKIIELLPFLGYLFAKIGSNWP